MKDKHCFVCLCRVAGSGVCGGTGSWITIPCQYLSSGSACRVTLMQPMSAMMANLSSLKVQYVRAVFFIFANTAPTCKAGCAVYHVKTFLEASTKLVYSLGASLRGIANVW